MHFQENGRNIFGRRQNICSQSPKRNKLFWEKNTKCPLHTKNNSWGFFLEKSFSKAKSPTPTLQNWKKNFSSGKKYRIFVLYTCFAVFRKVPSFFNQFSTKHAQVPKNFWGIKKKTSRLSSSSWMHFRKNCWKLFSPSSNFQAYSPKKKPNFRRKKAPKFPLHTKKMKNWVVFWRVFLKGWKFSAQKRKSKSIFSWKRYQILLLRTYLAFLRKELEFFFPKIDIKSSISTQKSWGIKKKPGRCLPRLDCTFESTVENISGKPWKVRLTVQNNHNFLGKNVTKKSSAHKNWKTRTFVEDFSIIVWKFPARGTWFKNRCIWKRLPKCSFAQVFWNLEIRVNFVKLKLQ